MISDTAVPTVIAAVHFACNGYSFCEGSKKSLSESINLSCFVILIYRAPQMQHTLQDMLP